MVGYSFQDFSVDIWFCYGSFSYGMESHIYSWENDSLFLAINGKNAEESLSIESFMESILDKPRGLLRIELRIFGPDRIFKQHRINNPIFLYTDMLPQLTKIEDSTLILQFISPRGVTATNTENWMHLLKSLFHSYRPQNVTKEKFYDGRKNHF